MTEPPRELRLPRSGVVLKRLEGGSWPKWRSELSPLRFEITDLSRADWTAWWAGVSVGGVYGRADTLRNRDECISWLDARVLELRAALLSGARETIAKVLYENPDAGAFGGDVRRQAQSEALADAVLAALGGDK